MIFQHGGYFRLKEDIRLQPLMTSVIAERTSLESRTGIAPRRAWLEPLLLALVLGVWFGYELNMRALWSPDEGRYAEIAREMVANGDYLTPRLNGVKYFEKPPLVYWLTAGSIKVFGLNGWALRLWPALFALLGGLAVYFIGRQLYGSRTGLFAAGMLAVSPLYDLLGGALILDMPLAALLTITLGAFLLGVRAPPGALRRAWFYTFYICAALAVLTKGLVGLALPGLVIGAWIALMGEWRMLRVMYLPSGLLIFLLIAVPWHALAAQANPEFVRFYFIHEHFERYLTTVHDRYQPVWFFIPVLFVGMYPWSAFLPRAVHATFSGLWRERRWYRELWFLLLWAVLPFVFFSLSSSKLIPYILPVLPPLALLLGRWFAHIWENGAPFDRKTLGLLLVLGVGFAAIVVAAPHLWAQNAHVTAIAAQLGAGVYMIAGALLLAGVLPFCAHARSGARATLAALLASATLVVAVFDLTLARLDVGHSVKEIALEIRRDLRPEDEVVTYREYYQDLPVYLERRITVVAWKGELAFGTTIEDTSAWMIDKSTFRQRWRAPRTIYLLTSPERYQNELRATPPGPMCVVNSTERVVVAVNRECKP